MDKSLDELIKENPRKFSLKKGGAQKRNNNNSVATKKKGVLGKKMQQQQRRTGASQGARATAGRQGGPSRQKNGVSGGKIVKSKLKKQQQKAPIVVDARNKLLLKNRLKITDARDRLAAIAKKTDLRQKLTTKKAEPVKKLLSLKLKTLRNQKLVREVGRGAFTRTIISRTVQNELVQPQYNAALPQFVPRYQPLPPPPVQYYQYQEPEVAFDFKRSTAAMDCEPVQPVSKRIRATDKRLGPREEPKARSDLGHRVYVDNLHSKVTQEDIIELFGDVGQLIRATLQRPGMAEVVYVRREDALRAVETYHNRQLDGLPMHCTSAANYELRREEESPAKSRTAPASGVSGGKGNIAPDIGTIHKALFNKTSSNAQIFTVTLPKKDI